jgi:hypothetical protein
MAVSAHTPPYGQKQRVRTPCLAIVELVLDALPHVGTAGQHLHLSLMQNYMLEPSRLCHELIFFDIGNSRVLEDHTAKMSGLASQLEKG